MTPSHTNFSKEKGVGEMGVIKKPHAVCIPYPSQGHINAMMNVANLLHHKGFDITFVHTEFNYNRLLNSGGPNSLITSPTFRFETIRDGLPPPENPNATQNIVDLCVSTAENCFVPFRDLLNRLNESSSSLNIPPVSCIVSDGIMTFTLKAAKEVGVPEVFLWPMSAISLMCYLHYTHLQQRGFSPLKDASCFTNGYLDNTIDWIPGTGTIRLRDIPTNIWTTDPKDKLLKFAIEEFQRIRKASAIILNTFDELEIEVLNPLSSMLNRIYTIGPAHLLLKRVTDENAGPIGSSLWKEDPGCLKWLDSKELGSVIYVNFGSITVKPPQELVELAWGLANSMQNFLWIFRPDLVKDGSPVLSNEFIKEINGRGFITSWCDQEKVLSHRSIGGFLTHCGWNSTIESLSVGVPMICWPFFSDQQTNTLCCCARWGVGAEIEDSVKREKVTSVVRELMEGERGKEMKRRVMDWRKKAEEATSPCGSSFMNFDKMVREVLLSPRRDV